MEREKRVVSGTVDFVWHASDSDPSTLVTLEPDELGAPHTFEIDSELLEPCRGVLAEGQRIEISYVHIVHEVVDPESGKTSEGSRPHITAVRILS